MSLFKRKIGRRKHVGRRVVGVGAGVALIVLGLQAPAFAAAPVVSSFTPGTGPASGGCVVVITGTGLDDFPRLDPDTKMEFVDNLVPATFFAAADFSIISDTEVWAVAPATLVSGHAYNLRFANDGGTNTSTGTFLAVDGAGACAPTIASFLPTCGSAGSSVTITGTNLLTNIAGPDTIDGGAVRFSPYAADATGTIPDIDSATTLGVVVPSGAGDGPIRVTTFATGIVNSTTSFLVPPPDCVPDTGNDHARGITFKINKKGKASGVVSSTEDPAFTDCVAAVPVKIQRKKAGGGWKTVGNTTTTDTGSYTKKVKNKPGKQKFRALAPKVSLGDPVTDVCSKAKSATRKV